jgi:putative transposase
MYSYKERLRALKLYLKYGRRLKATICELGYPTKNSLKAWCAEFEEGGNLQEKYVCSLPKYSDEQKNTAIEHYVNHGRCFAFTRRALGYPSRQKLSEWVCERYPEAKKTVVGKVSKPAASLDLKRAAVYARG